MGKKSIQQSSKHQKKQQIHNLIKILRPKVYITDSSNFKNLVQQLTGNPHSLLSSPSPSPSPPVSPPTPPLFTDAQEDHIHAYQENNVDFSFDSSSFTTPLEGSPDLRVPDSFNSVIESQNIDFESLLMEMDSFLNNYEACYDDQMIQQDQVCVYDYDLSSFI